MHPGWRHLRPLHEGAAAQSCAWPLASHQQYQRLTAWTPLKAKGALALQQQCPSSRWQPLVLVQSPRWPYLQHHHHGPERAELQDAPHQQTGPRHPLPLPLGLQLPS